jgi:Amt family ammonium transporter
MVGGLAGLTHALVLGKRKHRFINDKEVAESMFPQNPTMIVFGTLQLWFCWFFFNGGGVGAATPL